jgi:hypothetical protein
MPFKNKSKKYWIIPQESLCPGDLPLGSILKQPNDLIDILNRHAVEAIDASFIIKEREQVSKSLNSAVSNGFGANLEASSVLAAVIGASPTVGAEWSRSSEDSIEATRVRAMHFSPSDEYANRALRAQQVSDYIGQSFFTAPVYMIVGIAIASNVSRLASKSRNLGLKGGAGLGPPGTGVEVSADLSTNREVQSSYRDAVEDDVVLAYRLRRFRYSKMRGQFIKKKDDESHHARYELDPKNPIASDDEDEDESTQHVPVFSYFEEDDFVATGPAVGGFMEIDEDDESSDESSYD